MRVLVTGGAGFIGSHVVEAALAAGDAVLAVDNLTSGSRDNLPAACEFAHVDITGSDATRHAVLRWRPDAVAHLAAQTSVSASVADPAHDAAVNITGTLTVLDAAVAAGCRTVVFASSSTVYGDPRRQPVREDDELRPVSPYGVSKAAGEHYVRVVCGAHGIAHSVLRLGNVVGPRDSPHNHHAVTSFVHALAGGVTPVIEWDGEQAKDYVYAGDVASAVMRAVHGGVTGVFNIAGGRPTSVNELYRMVSEAMGRDVAPLHAPRRPGDVRRFVMDCARAREALDWRATTTLQEAIALTVAEPVGTR
ncbi:MAG: GDP-mannose 4,6-dehydratase [Candidatus Dormibacteraeota bacterium]|nr:GDP-mannose 4,6-dehydratase [Candidatus Dormibacteraeota bacterium]MBV9524694.1 GDP-mannose 4,6-dehydratase [Candidatus Dormibacteraeota bacterium]